LLVGPVFIREVVTAPRRLRFYLTRSIYVAVLLMLMGTAWAILAGTQTLEGLRNFANLGIFLFEVLAPLQLALAMLFSAFWTASAIALEKDRGTLVLLLLTNLTNSELVLGKLLASILSIFVMLLAALPAFCLIALPGGISFPQIANVFAVTILAALAAGSLGSTIGLWRDKTFQSVATTTVLLGLWVGFWELVATGNLGLTWAGWDTSALAACFSPWQALRFAMVPQAISTQSVTGSVNPVVGFFCTSVTITIALNLLAITRVRIWNPTRQARRVRHVRREAVATIAPATERSTTSETARPAVTRDAAHVPSRRVWDNPILWREMQTWAYGRKVVAVRLIYVLLAVGAAIFLYNLASEPARSAEAIPASAQALVPLICLSLLLINAQSVSAITSERDGRALDLLLVSDLMPKEIIFGKIGGILYNSKEAILLPLALCGYLWWLGGISTEDLLFLTLGLVAVFAFVTMVGVHAGITYSKSGSALTVSLGTVAFLILGIGTCMRLMIALESFAGQLLPFLAFLGGGSVALYVALGWRNPSPAIFWASLLLPIATFYAITSFLIDLHFAAFAVTVATYGFATIAMLIPAIYEFDIATGRTTAAGE